jgi:hypothetical protein
MIRNKTFQKALGIAEALPEEQRECPVDTVRRRRPFFYYVEEDR